MSTTVPYPEDARQRGPVLPGPRLVIAFSCDDPTGQVNDWSGMSVDLTGATGVLMGRADSGFELARSRFGAGELLTFQIPDAHMSTRHMRMALEADERWHIRDSDSMNGVWINGEQITEATLVDNDVIEVGMTILLFRTASPTPPTPAPIVLAEDDEEVAAGRVDELIPELHSLNPELSAMVATLRRLASSRVAVLVSGQTGVGKEVVTRAIHRLSGRSGPLIPVNCGAIPETLIESELLGVERGAYSGAHRSRPGLIRSANGGTLFLDEVAELPTSCQAVLLRVLQEGQVTPVGGTTPFDIDVRLVAATHQDLEKRVESGRFRRDLLARLRGFTIVLPPLCERREDIGLLIARLLRRRAESRADDTADEARDAIRKGVRFSRQAARQMFIYHWPDNVRELEKALQAAVLLAENGLIELEHLPKAVAQATGIPVGPKDELALKAAIQQQRARQQKAREQNRQVLSEDEIAAARQGEQLWELYEEHGGNVSALARALNTSRSQVRRLLVRHGIRDKK